MEESNEIKAKFREMVAYCLGPKDSEVIDNYTETFLTIHKEGVAEYKKDVDELVESIPVFDPATQAYYDELKTKLKVLSMSGDDLTEACIKLERERDEAHDQALLEVENMSILDLTRHNYLAIKNKHFNSLYKNGTYKGRTPLQE